MGGMARAETLQKTHKPALAPSPQSDDRVIETTLRPQTLGEFVGQETIKRQLRVFLAAARKRGEPIEHVLFSGPAGLGKTTLAMILAREMGVNIRVTSGTVVEKAGDLGAILTNLEERDILFIDEIHRLPRTIEETLYAAMEDFVLDVILGQGPAAKTVRLTLPHFSIVGATTRVGALSAPMRDRFGVSHRLQFYEPEDIRTILHRSAKILGVRLEDAAAVALARCSRGTPRIANRLLKRARDLADVDEARVLTAEIAARALAMLDVDRLGLDQTDREILSMIIDAFHGGPVGVETLSAATQEDVETLEGVYEPYLLQLGMIKRTPRGRVAMPRAYTHLGRPLPRDRQHSLL